MKEPNNSVTPFSFNPGQAEPLIQPNLLNCLSDAAIFPHLPNVSTAMPSNVNTGLNHDVFAPSRGSDVLLSPSLARGLQQQRQQQHHKPPHIPRLQVMPPHKHDLSEPLPQSYLGAGHTCMALLRHHESCTTKVGISPDHHGYCAWRHWRHGGNLKSATTQKLVAKHKSGSATFAALSLLDLLDLGKISFSSLVMKWTADQEQLLLSLYFEVNHPTWDSTQASTDAQGATARFKRREIEQHEY